MDTLIDNRAADRGTGADAGSRRLPPRPRRRWLTPASAALLAAVTCAVGFYVGVRVEKSSATSSRALPSAAAGLAARAGAAGSRTSLFARRFGGAGAPGGAGGGSTGTVSSVDGSTLVVTELSGNAVKVKLTSATKITKTESVGRDRIHPGDTVVVSGVTGANGTISAASVTDAGAGPGTGAAAPDTGSASDSGPSKSPGSAIGSLFSGG